MLNIKEIALRIAGDFIKDAIGKQNIIEFAEALIAEIQKQNEPVGWTNEVELDYLKYVRADGDDPSAVVWNKCHEDSAIPLYAFPPIPEQKWRTIEYAPKDKRCIVWSGQEMYCAHWSQNPFTGDEAWIVAELGSEGDQALVKPTHWMPLPEAPKGEEK